MFGRTRWRAAVAVAASTVTASALAAGCSRDGGSTLDTQGPPIQLASDTSAGTGTDTAGTGASGTDGASAREAPAGATSTVASGTSAAGSAAPAISSGTSAAAAAEPGASTTSPVTTVPITGDLVAARLAPLIDQTIDAGAVPDPLPPAAGVPLACPGAPEPPIPPGAHAHEFGRSQTLLNEGPGGAQPTNYRVSSYVFNGPSAAAQFASSLSAALRSCPEVEIASTDGVSPVQRWKVGVEEAQVDTALDASPESFAVSMEGTFGDGEASFQRQVRAFVIVVGPAVGISSVDGLGGTDSLDTNATLIATSVQHALVEAVRPPNVTAMVIGQDPAEVVVADVATNVAGVFTQPLSQLQVGEGFNDSGSEDRLLATPISCNLPSLVPPAWPQTLARTYRSAQSDIGGRPADEIVVAVGMGFATPEEAHAWVDGVGAAANCGQYVRAESAVPGEEGTSTVEPLTGPDGQPGIRVRQRVTNTKDGRAFRVARTAEIYVSGRAVLYLQHDIPLDVSVDFETAQEQVKLADLYTNGGLGMLLIQAGATQ